MVEGLSLVPGAFLNVPDFNFRVNSRAVFETFRGCLFFLVEKKNM